MIVGSILHGAYGDYYEQIVGLRWLAKCNPNWEFVLFFASESRMREMRVFDLQIPCRVFSVACLGAVPVDMFFQYQAHDPELRANVFAKLDASLLEKIRPNIQRLPWHDIRRIWNVLPAACDVPLTGEGRGLLESCIVENGIDREVLFSRRSIGFLWRYRAGGGAVAPYGQMEKSELMNFVSDVLNRLHARYGTHAFVCGMGVETTDENRHRVDRKFEVDRLDLISGSSTYLKGLSWGLELEIIRLCYGSLVMPSGFSEALWLKRGGSGVVLLNPPLHYVAKCWWNRMPLFGLTSVSSLVPWYLSMRSVDTCVEYLAGKLGLAD